MTNPSFGAGKSSESMSHLFLYEFVSVGARGAAQVQLRTELHVAHHVAPAQHSDQCPVPYDRKLVDPVRNHQLEGSAQVSFRGEGLSGMRVITPPTVVVAHASCGRCLASVMLTMPTNRPPST